MMPDPAMFRRPERGERRVFDNKLERSTPELLPSWGEGGLRVGLPCPCPLALRVEVGSSAAQ